MPQLNATYGQKSTFTSDLNSAIWLEDNIGNYPDRKVPLIKRWDSKVFEKDVTKPIYGWLEQENRKKFTTISAEMAIDATYFSAVEYGVFNRNDVVRIGDEYMRVESVQGSQINVQRAVCDTIAAVHAADARAIRVGIAAAEGAKAGEMVIIPPSKLYNYSQIFDSVVSLTGTQNESLIKGDEKAAKLLSRAEKDIWEQVQMGLLFGRRGYDPAKKTRYMGGLEWFIKKYAPDNVVGGSNITWGTSTSLEVFAVMEKAVGKVIDNCGEKLTIYTDQKGLLNLTMLEYDKLWSSNRKDGEKGIGVATHYLSQLGKIPVVLVPDETGLINGNFYFVDEDKVGYKTYKGRGMRAQQMGKDGDRYKWQVLTELTMKLATPKVAAIIDWSAAPTS